MLWTVFRIAAYAKSLLALLVPVFLTTAAASEVQFLTATDSVRENISVKQIVVVASPLVDRDQASVRYEVSGGTAVEGIDFILPAGTLTWTRGETTFMTIDIEIIDDHVPEPDETVEIRLFEAVNATIGEPNLLELTILDNDPTRTPTSAAPTSTLTPTSTRSPSPSVTPTASPSATPSDSSTPTLSPTASSSPTHTPVGTPTNSATPTSTNTPSATSTVTAAATVTVTATPSPTATWTSAPTETPSATATAEPAATETPTTTPTTPFTKTATATTVVDPTDTPSATPVESATDTPTPVPTTAPTDSPTGTPSAVPTHAVTDSPTPMPTTAPTDSPTGTPTDSQTPTLTETPSATTTFTPTPTSSDTPTVTNTPLSAFVELVLLNGDPAIGLSRFDVGVRVGNNRLGAVGGYRLAVLHDPAVVVVVEARDAGHGFGLAPNWIATDRGTLIAQRNVFSTLDNGLLCILTFATSPNLPPQFQIDLEDFGADALTTTDERPIPHVLGGLRLIGATPTPTPTVTYSPTVTVTGTPSPTVSPIASPTATDTPEIAFVEVALVSGNPTLPDTSFEVAVRVSNNTLGDVVLYAFHLGWDPAVLQYGGVRDGGHGFGAAPTGVLLANGVQVMAGNAGSTFRNGHLFVVALRTATVLPPFYLIQLDDSGRTPLETRNGALPHVNLSLSVTVASPSPTPSPSATSSYTPTVTPTPSVTPSPTPEDLHLERPVLVSLLPAADCTGFRWEWEWNAVAGAERYVVQLRDPSLNLLWQTTVHEPRAGVPMAAGGLEPQWFVVSATAPRALSASATVTGFQGDPLRDAGCDNWQAQFFLSRHWSGERVPMERLDPYSGWDILRLYDSRIFGRNR